MSGLRIAVDALGLPPVGGARTSTLNWLLALAERGQEHHYLVFVSQAETVLTSLPNVEQRIVEIRHRLRVRVWAQLRLPAVLAAEEVHLLHCMKNLGVIGAPCPTIVTVNDLTHVILEEIYPWVDRLYWRRLQPCVLRHAARVIAISENTRRDLERFYDLNGTRIVTIYPSCSMEFRRSYAAEDLERVRAKYDLPDSFLLYVGGLGVHKNVVTLIRAFRLIHDEVHHGLVLVGGEHHTTSDHRLASEVSELGLTERVLILGSIPQEDLPPLYHLADLFLTASLNEGFGLVLLESMACGTPILAAATGSIPEVVGHAAKLVADPFDAQAFADSIRALLTEPETCAEMSAEGLERSRAFTWERTADQTLALYEEVVSERR